MDIGDVGKTVLGLPPYAWLMLFGMVLIALGVIGFVPFVRRKTTLENIARITAVMLGLVSVAIGLKMYSRATEQSKVASPPLTSNTAPIPVPTDPERYAEATGVLEKYNPEVFVKHHGEKLEVARILADQPGFGAEAMSTISGAKHSVDVLAFTGHDLLANREDVLSELLQNHPVTVRLLLMDSSNSNFSEACRAMGYELHDRHNDADNTKKLIKRVKKRIADSGGQFQGTLEVRWFATPLFYSMILRDAGRDSQFIKVGVYTSQKYFRPYFVADGNAQRLAANLKRDFDARWETALRD